MKLNARMHKSDPTYFQRKDLLLLRSAPPELKFNEAMSSCKSLAERSGDWEPWLAAMKDFARDSQFPKIFNAVARALKPRLAGLRERVVKSDYIGKIERYTGLPFHGRYRMIVSPLTSGRGLNRVWTRDDGRHEIASIPSSYTEDLDATAWHELGHGVLDMTVDLYDHEKKDVPLELGPDLRHNCRNWLHGMREHLVRAVMIRLIARERDAAAATKQYEAEEFSRRPHLAAFLDRLREYEDSRRRYPNLADFYPRLLEVFPKPSAIKKTNPSSLTDEPWPNALRRLAGPFYTREQRAAAAFHLDLMLANSDDERLILRRAALNYLLGKHDRAAEDVSVLLGKRPGDVAALLRWGSALLTKAKR